MGTCKEVYMDDESGTQVVKNGSGTWETGKGLLTIDKGAKEGKITANQTYTVTSAGGKSPPPKGDYTCLNDKGNKKTFRKA